MPYYVDLQIASTTSLNVNQEELLAWAKLPLTHHNLDAAELTVRLVDKSEIQALNNCYRKQDKATNVLAFPSRLPPEIQLTYPLLGDVIICPEIIEEEAITYNKPISAHWAHILIHGVLHLLGYDHIEPDDAEQMMALEVKLVQELGFANPYGQEELLESTHVEG
ncbi:MAG: rRNA maturation RNase YbeY [Legionella sp.]|nr:rRNA maturation RNase YbeY [Legionella sp.]